MNNRKRAKDAEYQLFSTGSWKISPQAQKIVDKLAAKRTRKEAW